MKRMMRVVAREMIRVITYNPRLTMDKALKNHAASYC